MKFKKYIIDKVKYCKSDCFDNRDIARLTVFLTEEELKKHDIDTCIIHASEHMTYTEENVLTCLKRDLEYAFNAALSQRIIVAGQMFRVIMMWLTILEDDKLIALGNKRKTYKYNGLPFYKAVALAYGFDNPIGKDKGSELKYYY